MLARDVDLKNCMEFGTTSLVNRLSADREWI